MTLNLTNLKELGHLETLDWSKIVGEITNFSHFEEVKKWLYLPIKPLERKEIEFQFDSIEFFLKNIDFLSKDIPKTLYSLPSSAKSYEHIKNLKKGHISNIEQLNSIARILECFFSINQSFIDWNRYRKERFLESSVTTLKKKFIAPFRRFVDPNGQTHFEKHPEIGVLYAKIKTVEENIKGLLNSILSNNDFCKSLQLNTYDIMNNKFVLAIRSDHYRSEMGSIIAHSKTGMTLYIEPFEIRELSNKRLYLLTEVDAKIAQICQSFSDLVNANHHFVSESLDFIYSIDLFFSKSSFIFKNSLKRPEISKKKEIKLTSFFHPLIKNPVKNDIYLFDDNFGMVISGPNTGGKSVTLKSVSICLLFMHYGLFLPAEESCLYPFKYVFYFSNDHQSIEDGLSSFSAEATLYIKLLKELEDVQSSSFLAIDEIFNTTSSDEASCLALALIEKVKSLGNTKFILTTHHEQLKKLVQSEPDIVSAHVGFDFNTSQPTYRLIIGTPGKSLAIKVFRELLKKNNFNTSIADRSEALLGKDHIDYNELLKSVEEKSIELDHLISANREVEQQLMAQKDIFERNMEKKKFDIVSNLETKTKKILESAKKMKESALNQATSLKQLHRDAHKIQKDVSSLYPQKEQSDLPLPAFPEQIELGKKYFLPTINKNVLVVKIDEKRKKVFVQHGKMNLWTPINQLRVCSSGDKKREPSVRVYVEREETNNIEFDCRGMKLDEFKTLAERVVYDVINGSIPFALIIHGHGNGILKKWLRVFLKSFNEIQYETPEGNDGATKICLS